MAYVKSISLRIVLLVGLLGFLATHEVAAQFLPHQQCRQLNKARRPKKQRFFRKEKGGEPYTWHPKPSYREQVKTQEPPPSKATSPKASTPSVAKTEQKPKPPAEKLPPPISEKHARIREEVRKRLESMKPGEPTTESLYFVTDQDEFAILDMEPFLIAAEFALQGRVVLVEGHTDNRGSDDYNLQLSMKRVNRIQELMHQMGVPEDRVSVMGYGESQPKYDNNTEEGRQKNRRVDFKIF
ncbi:OmpA family protein [Catalinimonas alkaloidigena]|uniref:OmpA family protein n=1 Tax=Catalinimonas alkaloidigena TaxID=1075417 RepID=A0A1G9JGK3_9BACT|nr:OmpA family protein [Catalinimonas alkaloidigena]SDL36608.1 OmpA family protein [Catalinimonas alkaloidigena]